MTILDQLAAHARKRVAAYKAILPLEEVRRQCEALPKGSFALDAALAPGQWRALTAEEVQKIQQR